MVRRLERYDRVWAEEPVVPDELDGYVAVHEAAPMPISGGEREFTRGHKEFSERKTVDILQPDIYCCGGLTDLQKIAV